MSKLHSGVIEGHASFRVAGEDFQTWYKVVGDLKARRPLVALHGGPGLPHYYMLSLSDLAHTHGIPIIFYDQLGVGNSTYLPDKPTEFWTPELFMDEMENLLAHLGVLDEFDLLGHSWGGMLAAQYAATRSPKGMKRLVISNSTASQPMWQRSLDGLVSALPEVMQKNLRQCEQDGSFDSQSYREAIGTFYSRHLCRMETMPMELLQTFGGIGEKSNVLFSMYGPSQLQTSGSLKDWTIVPELHRISVPTLVLNGRYDEAQDDCVRPFFDHIPRVKWYTFAESGHMPHWEEREKYMQLVSDFLSD